jgi:hypothetical protein
VRSESSLYTVLEALVYPQAALAANPHTAALAADFEPVIVLWTTVNNQEIQLRVSIVKARAYFAGADDALDEIVDRVAAIILQEVKNDRTAPLYLLYFGNQSPSELRRPVLAGQLETMRTWVSSLKASSIAALQAAGNDLEAAVAAADNAVKALAKSEQDNRVFRTTGERRALVDSTNAVRKGTYGKVAEMPHAHPEWHLPASFPDRFFPADSKKDTPPATSADIEAQIASLKSQIVELEADLVKAKADEDAKAQAKAADDAHAAAVAEAEKEATAAAAKLAALKAKKK